MSPSYISWPRQIFKMKTFILSSRSLNGNPPSLSLATWVDTLETACSSRQRNAEIRSYLSHAVHVSSLYSLRT